MPASVAAKVGTHRLRLQGKHSTAAILLTASLLALALLFTLFQGSTNVHAASGHQRPEFYYDAYIQADLSPWREHGITEELVEEAMSEQYIECWWTQTGYEESAVRVQIVDGRLWVTHFPWAKWPDGVVPFGLTPWDGTNWPNRWTAASKARVPLLTVALLDVLRSFPGQIPDLDAIFSTFDVPCVPRHGLSC